MDDSDHELAAAIAALTPRAKRVLVAAWTEAKARGMTWVGTEHLLVGLIDDERGIAAQLLQRAQIDTELRRQVTEALDRAGYPSTANRDTGDDYPTEG
jgi:ATP-dependent Clp protease ATP-binding subunit ClpC